MASRLLPIVLALFLASRAFFFLHFIPKSTASIILDFRSMSNYITQSQSSRPRVICVQCHDITGLYHCQIYGKRRQMVC